MNFASILRFSALPAHAALNALVRPSVNNNLKVLARTYASHIQIKNIQRRVILNLEQRKLQNARFVFRYLASAAAVGSKGGKKRSLKKRYSSEVDPDTFEEGQFPVMAFATAKEYDLEHLKIALVTQDLYSPQRLSDQNIPDVLLTVAKYKVGHEPRHIFFFREGCVVFWNCGQLESSEVLNFLKGFELEPFEEKTVIQEREAMCYKYQVPGKKCHLQGSAFMLGPEPDNILERYTFSNAMAQSVKLGIWEATLDQYADSIATVTEDIERGQPIRMTREQVLCKTGALYALRHHINLESDLLDTPDFYWEQAELEKLYGDTIGYFSIGRRTRVLNEKLSHCAESVELVGAQLSDRHHVRLEWMIIILIMVEVGFETLHFLERYWEGMDAEATHSSHVALTARASDGKPIIM